MKQLLLDLSLAHPPTLDNFIVGSNAELVALLGGIPKAPMGERFVYIWGQRGCGKTHLLRAAVSAATEAGLSAAYVDAAQFPASADGLAQFALVAVDNAERLSADAQIALFNVYNEMREGAGRLLVSGPCAPAQLGLRQDLVTRLGWGLIYQVRGLSDAEKAQALLAHAQGRGFALPREVAEYLLRHWRRDLPSLLAALDALDRYSLETKRAITVPMLREVMQSALDLG